MIALEDDKINVTEKLKFVLGRVENIMGKGENAGNQHFLLLPYCFQKASLSGSVKVDIVWYRVNYWWRYYVTNLFFLSHISNKTFFYDKQLVYFLTPCNAVSDTIIHVCLNIGRQKYDLYLKRWKTMTFYKKNPKCWYQAFFPLHFQCFLHFPCFLKPS